MDVNSNISLVGFSSLSTIETEDERRVLPYFQTQQRLLLPFLCIDVTNNDICCNEAQKAQVRGALGADPQLTFTLSSYHVNNLEKVLVCSDLVRDANGKRLRVKAPVRTHLICNPSRRLVTHVICTSRL
ncbi:40S ribosomal protein S20-2 [Glycine max]|nr:40S ribosomal protein S20-2 [Glycine max]